MPVEYKIRKKFDIKTFVTSDLTTKEKIRFRETVLDIMLEYQIVGEAIPSLIDEEYDCQAILLFDVKLTSMKEVNFVGSIIQRLVKSLCIVRFYDIKGLNIYHFADKRLNIQDKSQVVIEDIVITAPTSVEFDDEVNTLMRKYVAFYKIKNQANKFSFYLEMMVKSYVISNMLLWSGSKRILDSKIWYNVNSVLDIYDKMKQIGQLKREKKVAKTVAENSKINSELKMLYAELTKIIDIV